ncbi:MAG: transposase [Rhodopirellula sp.]|nr:transposase [Rhodopirellula sp.]
MARAALERVLDAERVDQVFHDNATHQYEYVLPFSGLLKLLGQVVLRKQPSVNAAYQAADEKLEASVTAVYRKLARTELPISEALVAHSFAEASATVRKLRASEPAWITGYTTRILDGNHPAATEHRIEELRHTWDAPLPGKALVVYRPELRLIEQVHLTDDGHAQERRLLDDVIATIKPRDLWVADRNFCTIGFLTAIHQRRGVFLIRQHGTLKGVLIGKRRRIGSDDTGDVYEQQLRISDDPEMPPVRRITVVLNEPTRDGETELHILSNVPMKDASARKLAALYRKRWTIKTVIADITRTLTGEIPSLGYPPAALLALCLSFVICP